MDIQSAHRLVATAMIVSFVTIAIAQNWVLILRNAIASKVA